MELGVFVTLDLYLTLAFFAVQWRLLVLLGRWEDGSRRLAATIRFVIIAAAIGYALSFSWIVAALHFPARLSAYWGAASVCYLIVSTLGYIIFSLLRPIRHRLLSKVDPGRRKVLQLATNALISAPFAVIAYGGIASRTDFEVQEVDLPLPDLPRDLEGMRILQLSDIHLGAFLSEGELARVVDAARGLRPHLAVFTGDFISTMGDPLEECIRQLARVKAEAGLFGCLGNHEYYAQVQSRATALAARNGIRILRAEAQALRFGNATLQLAGVDHQSALDKKSYLRGAESLVYPGALNMLLSHNPDVFPVAASKGFNITLSGHTHGGQVTVEILDRSINPARFFTPYVQGLYQQGSAVAYVTRGIGTIGIPARIGAPPEISLLRLRKA
jgi:predicted MPP superfamily phosphohydrolase